MENILQDLPPEERFRILQENAYKIEEGKYAKKLTEDELIVKREKLTENFIEISDLEEEKKEFVDNIKKQQNPLLTENKTLLTEVKTKVSMQEGTLFLLADQDNSLMNTYNELGEWIDTRRLRPDEKQANIFKLNKAQ